MLDDINKNLFHWQSQYRTSIDSKTAKRYLNHKKNGDKNLLCVRDTKKDELGRTQNYYILGYCDYVSHEGSRPISITWKLHEPIPPRILKITSKYFVN